MKIANLLVQIDTSLNQAGSGPLDLYPAKKEGKIVELVTGTPQSFLKRVMNRETFVYQDIFQEDPNSEEDVHHQDIILKKQDLYTNIDISFMKDIKTDSSSDHSLYSLRRQAKKILSELVGREVYISLYNLNYRDPTCKEVSSSPLFLIPVSITIDSGEIKIVATSNNIVFNRTLIHRIKQIHDIDINYNAFEFILGEYLAYIESVVKSVLLSISYEPSIFELDLTRYNQMVTLLENKVLLESSILTNVLYGGADSSIDNTDHQMIDTALPPLRAVYDELFTKHISALYTMSSAYKDELLQNIIYDHLKQKKSITVYSKDKTDELQTKIASWGLLSLSDLNIRGKNTLIDLVESNQTMLESSFADKPSEPPVYPNLERYLDLTNELERNYDWGFAISKPVFIERLANYTALGKAKYNFEIGEYSDSDMQLDLAFFSKFASLVSLSDTAFYEHPFYGLTKRAGPTTYQEIHITIIESLKKIDDFVSLLKSLDIDAWKIEKIRTLQDVERLLSHIQLLKRYDGFDLSLIRLDEKTIDLDELAEIKMLFSTESSLKLAIDNIASPGIWLLNIKDISTAFTNCNDKKVQKEYKNLLKETLKIADKKNITSAIRLLDLYSQNQTKLEAKIASLAHLRIALTSIDNILEIERAIEYKSDFARHQLLHDDIDFKNNDFINRYFSDNIFRDYLQSEVFPKIEDFASSVAASFDKLYSFFDSGEKQDYEMKSFTVVKKRLNSLLDTSYSAYLDYFNFLNIITQVSAPLRKVLNHLIESKGTFANLEVDFFTSVFEAYRQKSHDSSKAILNQLRLITPSLYADLERKEQDIHLEAKNTILKNIIEYLESPSYKKSVKEIKSIALYADIVRNDLLIEKFSSVVTSCKPLSLRSISNPFVVSANSNLTIILDSSSYTTLELLFIILSSNNILFINDKPSFFSGLEGEKIPLAARINEHHMHPLALLKSFDFTLMQDHLFNLLEYNANCLGLFLIRDYPYQDGIIPLALVRPGVARPIFVILPILKMDVERRNKFENLLPYLSKILRFKFRELSMSYAVNHPLDSLLDIIEPPLIPLTGQAKVAQPDTDKKCVIKEVKRTKSIQEVQERLETIRASFQDRVIFDKSANIDPENVPSYILSLLPLPLADYNQLSPFMETIAQQMIKEGAIYFEDGFLFPRQRGKINLRKGVTDLSKISNYEIQKAIFTYLTNFTFLTRKTLLNELAYIIGVSPDDVSLAKRVDSILETFLKERRIVIKQDNQISLFKN